MSTQALATKQDTPTGGESGPAAYLEASRELLAQARPNATAIEIDDIAHALAKGFPPKEVLSYLKRGAPTYKLKPGPFLPFVLTSIKQESYNVKRFRFVHPDGKKMPSPCASLWKFMVKIDGQTYVRSQTPVSGSEVDDYIDFLIKIYPDGKLTQHLDKLDVGDSVTMRGPTMKIAYPFKYDHIGMVAGGTGLTPMLQSTYEILRHPEDKTKISLIFANNTPRDIMMKDEIDRIQREHPDRFKVHYVVLDPEGSWTSEDGSTGYITPDILNKHLFPFSSPGKTASELAHNTETHGVFVCGPDKFYDVISGNVARDVKTKKKIQGPLLGYLKDLGFSEGNVFKF